MMMERTSLKRTLLDHVRRASPCAVLWTEMSGDAQVRRCQQCMQNVYDVGQLHAEHAEALICEREARPLTQLYHRLDGTLMARNCPVGRRWAFLSGFMMSLFALAASHCVYQAAERLRMNGVVIVYLGQMQPFSKVRSLILPKSAAPAGWPANVPYPPPSWPPVNPFSSSLPSSVVRGFYPTTNVSEEPTEKMLPETIRESRLLRLPKGSGVKDEIPP